MNGMKKFVRLTFLFLFVFSCTLFLFHFTTAQVNREKHPGNPVITSSGYATSNYEPATITSSNYAIQFDGNDDLFDAGSSSSFDMSDSITAETNIEDSLSNIIIQQCVNEVSQSNINLSLTQFEAFGLKQTTSQSTRDSLAKTRNWLISKLQSYGYTSIEQHSFIYNSRTYQNIIVNKLGTTFPDTMIVLDGHYDALNGSGVNDNGTGIALMLETARVLYSLKLKYTVKFIFFSCEEVNYAGSRAYVNDIVVPNSYKIKIVINADMIGYSNGNNTIGIDRDNNVSSYAYADTIATLTQKYTALNTSWSVAEYSDYIEFAKVGYTISGFWENTKYPYYHTYRDSLKYVDVNFVKEVTKASVASVIYFARLDLDIVTPITMLYFKVDLIDTTGIVRLQWATISEINNYGFFVERSSGDKTNTFVNIPNIFIPGYGTTVEPQEYTFNDSTIHAPGIYYYRLRQVDNDGLVHYSQTVSVSVSALTANETAPIEFKVHQNYPNPFNPTTTIKFKLPFSSKVKLTVYNLLGQEVCTLLNGVESVGDKQLVWSAQNRFASGVYFYRLEATSIADPSMTFTQVKKMILL
jgi:hypothetical protein